MGKPKIVTTANRKTKLNKSSNEIDSKQTTVLKKRNSLGSVLTSPAKRKLDKSISFLKPSKKKVIKSKPVTLTNEGRHSKHANKAQSNEIAEGDLELNFKDKITVENVSSAFAGITKFLESNPKLQKKLFDEQAPVFIQLSVHKIPTGHSKLLRIPLKHSIIGPDSEVCLIVPDVKGIKNAEHEQHVEHYEQLLRSKGVTNIKKIMTFHELRTEYETFELLHRLVDLYDIFLVDGRISGKVVNKCGKIFYTKRKVPTSVKLQVTNLKDHIEKALTKVILHLHLKGNGYTVQVGHTKMENGKIVENVQSAIEYLDKFFPGGFMNIKSIHMFAPRSVSIPIYMSFEAPASLEVPNVESKKPKAYKTYIGELSTQLQTHVEVQPTGEVILHKVQDESISEDDPERETEIEIGKSQHKLDKKKKSKKYTNTDEQKTKTVKKSNVTDQLIQGVKKGKEKKHKINKNSIEGSKIKDLASENTEGSIRKEKTIKPKKKATEGLGVKADFYTETDQQESKKKKNKVIKAKSGNIEIFDIKSTEQVNKVKDKKHKKNESTSNGDNTELYKNKANDNMVMGVTESVNDIKKSKKRKMQAEDKSEVMSCTDNNMDTMGSLKKHIKEKIIQHVDIVSKKDKVRINKKKAHRK